MLEAGAAGYVLKVCPLDELMTAVRTVAAGKRHLGSGLPGSILDYFLLEGRPRGWNALSQLERDVVRRLADGSTIKQIAAVHGVSNQTIGRQRESAMRKLGLNSIVDLVKFAIKQGLTSVDS